jgi:hypothetical protein
VQAEPWFRQNRALAVVIGATLVVVAGIVVLLGAGGDDGDDEPVAEPSSSTTLSTVATTTVTTGPPATASTATTDPVAPWRSSPRPREVVSEEAFVAWERARNRDTCALLVPSVFGEGMERPDTSATPINDDAGWEVVFRQGPAVVQIQGLFTKESRTERTPRQIFSRRWSDGSVARYGPDAVNPEDPEPDPETTAIEATLLLPDQDCAYVIYDTRGKSEMEFILEHLQFVEGTE